VLYLEHSEEYIHDGDAAHDEQDMSPSLEDEAIESLQSYAQVANGGNRGNAQNGRQHLKNDSVHLC
jgi:hypothetical protein